jgi:hypothetical protein
MLPRPAPDRATPDRATPDRTAPDRIRPGATGLRVPARTTGADWP